MESLFRMLCLATLISFGLSEDVTVETNLGNITGETEDITFAGSNLTIIKFLGIPFAEPPTGSLRFNKPVAKGPFSSTFIAKTVSPTCVQNWEMLRLTGGDPTTTEMEEDCLHLSIYVPGPGPISKSETRAVMVWVFGGGFQFGSKDDYDAKSLVGLNNVILVTFNYRLSLLGFLSSAEKNGSGNYGLWDQHMAIRWVHDHIGSFGGDPQRVTIFGESAGSASVIYQALYPGNAGLFQRVIAQSGSANSPWAYQKNPTVTYNNFVNKSGCLTESSSAMQVLHCLRNLTVAEIVELVGYNDEFNPVKDGLFVTMHPFDIFDNSSKDAWNILKQFGKLDVIIGVCSSEGGELIPVIDLLTKTNSTTKGYSKEAFESIIIPFSIQRAKLKQSQTLLYAFEHQYYDWSEPENMEKVFQNTVDLMSDIEYNNPVTKTALAHSDSGENGNLFFYVFDHKSILSDPRLDGASHAQDIPFMLGFPTGFAAIYTLFNIEIPQNEIELSKKLMTYWTNFAKSGNPNSAGLTTWPQYDSETQKYIRFQVDKGDFSVEERYAAERMNFWHSLLPMLEQQCDKTCPKCEEDKVSRASFFKAWTVLLSIAMASTLL